MSFLDILKSTGVGRSKSKRDTSARDARTRLEEWQSRLRHLEIRARDPKVREKAKQAYNRLTNAMLADNYSFGRIMEAIAQGESDKLELADKLKQARQGERTADDAVDAAYQEHEGVERRIGNLEDELAGLARRGQEAHAEATAAFTSAAEADDDARLAKASAEVSRVERDLEVMRGQTKDKQRVIDALKSGPLARAAAALASAEKARDAAGHHVLWLEADLAQIDFDLAVGQLLVAAGRCQSYLWAVKRDWPSLEKLFVPAFHAKHVLAANWSEGATLEITGDMVRQAGLNLSGQACADVLAKIEAEGFADAEADMHPDPFVMPAAHPDRVIRA